MYLRIKVQEPGRERIATESFVTSRKDFQKVFMDAADIAI